jgi:hypothetical protein
MRFFVALSVASLGLGCYAVAALLYDRRRHVALWLHRRRTATTAAASAGAAAADAPQAMAYLPILGCVVLGTLLVVGSCLGLIKL